MKPPRRSRKSLKPHSPNSPPEGLNQHNEASLLPRNEETSKASRIYRDMLKAKGWVHKKHGRDDWTFYPASLLKIYSYSVISKKGTEGIHYFSGWQGIADMLKRFGVDYAPTDLLPPVERNNVSDESIDDQSTLTADQDEDNMFDVSLTESLAGNHDMERQDGQENRDNGDGGDENEDSANNNSAMTAVEANEDESGQETVSEASNETRLLTTLECIKKCREEIGWLETNKDFHGTNDTKICKNHMSETIINLYSQVAAYNDVNVSRASS